MTYLIALIIFLLPSYLVRFSVFGVPTTLLEILIYIAFIITLIIQISNLKSKNHSLKLKTIKTLIPGTYFLIPIILFIISGIISVAIAPDKREALGLFKAYIVDPILFFWIILAEFSKEKKSEILSTKSETNSNFQNLEIKNSFQIKNFKLKILIKALILSGVVVAIHAIWQKFTGDVTVDGRVLGIFGLEPNASANYMAFYLAPIAVLTMGMEVVKIDLKKINFSAVSKIWLYDLSFLLMVMAIYYCGSRAAIGAVVVGVASIFVYKYWQKIKSKRFFVYMFICLIVLMIIVGWQQTKPNWNLANTQGGRVTSSNNIRWEIWNTTVKDIIPYNMIWLRGVGLGNYQPYFTEITKDRVNFPEWIAPKALTPHNLLLNIWVNLGLLGLVSFVWILFNFFNVISNQQPVTSNKQTNKNLVTCHLLLVTMMITILVQGLVDSPIWKNDLVIMFWLIIALSYINITQGEK